MASKAATSNGITLKGSVDIVTEFFGYSINRCATLPAPLRCCMALLLRRADPRLVAGGVSLSLSVCAWVWRRAATVAGTKPAAFCTRCASACVLPVPSVDSLVAPSVSRACVWLPQRGVYPPDQFTPLPKYGLTMLVTNDTALQEYLGNVTKMIRSECVAGRVRST
jgi:hypothetical protein